MTISLILFYLKFSNNNLKNSNNPKLEENITNKLQEKQNLFTEKEITDIMKIEKNNSINLFLQEANDGVYFLDKLKTTLKLTRINDWEFSHESSLVLGELDKRYTNLFVNNITPYFLRSTKDTLKIELMLPVNQNAKPKPPPPAIDFYGNTEGGIVPNLINNPYNYENN